MVHDELELVATINEDHTLIFKYPEIGDVLVHFDAENDPEYMELACPAFTQTISGVLAGVSLGLGRVLLSFREPPNDP